MSIVFRSEAANSLFYAIAFLNYKGLITGIAELTEFGFMHTKSSYAAFFT
jgi:hypothetical protein